MNQRESSSGAAEIDDPDGRRIVEDAVGLGELIDVMGEVEFVLRIKLVDGDTAV
jgi:hypothetical protein